MFTVQIGHEVDLVERRAGDLYWDALSPQMRPHRVSFERLKPDSRPLETCGSQVI